MNTYKSKKKNFQMSKCEKLKSEMEFMVKEMKEKGDFNSVEGKILARLYLEKNLDDFDVVGKKTIRKLLRHPFKIVVDRSNRLFLTETGLSVARGYLKGLKYK
jgi:hypothetical protein